MISRCLSTMMRRAKGLDVLTRFCWPGVWSLVALLVAPEVAPAKTLIVAVKSLEAEPYSVAFRGFQETLSGKGQDVTIKEYVLTAGGSARERLLLEIRERRPSLILTLGTAGTAWIHAQVKDVPVVFCMVLNPVVSGFVQSMQSSGNNLTGAALDIPAKLQFEALRAVVPSIKKVGVVYNPRDTGELVEAGAKVAPEVGLELIGIPVGSADKLQETLATLEKRKIDALWAVADSTVFSSERSIELFLRKTIEYRIPFMGLSPAFVKAGALLALSVDYRDVGVQCGDLAALVLAGQPPRSLPILAPRRVTLYLNLNVAKAVGVSIPPQAMEGAVVLR